MDEQQHSDDRCRSCGGKVGALVCLHCGATVRRGLTAEEEREALDELHGSLVRSDVGDKILKQAFIPDDVQVLINAGLRMLPVLEGAVAQDGAAGRLRAITIKLRLRADDPSVLKAAKELEIALDRYERHDRSFGWWMIGIIVTIIAVIVYAATR